FLRREETRALHHDVDAEFAPRQFSRVAVREHADLVAVYDEIFTVHRHFTREAAVRGVVLGQMRVGFGIAEVVDRHELEVVFLAVLIERAQRVSANPAIAVDCDANRHCYLLVTKKNLHVAAANRAARLMRPVSERAAAAPADVSRARLSPSPPPSR